MINSTELRYSFIFTVNQEIFEVKIFSLLPQNAKIYLAKFIQQQKISTASNYGTIGNMCSNYDELCNQTQKVRYQA